MCIYILYKHSIIDGEKMILTGKSNINYEYSQSLRATVFLQLLLSFQSCLPAVSQHTCPDLFTLFCSSLNASGFCNASDCPGSLCCTFPTPVRLGLSLTDRNRCAPCSEVTFSLRGILSITAAAAALGLTGTATAAPTKSKHAHNFANISASSPAIPVV